MIARFFLFGLFINLLACSSTKIIQAPRLDALPARIAIQPLEFEAELTREHQSALERVTLAALRNRGFLVATPASAPDTSVQLIALPSVKVTISSLRRDSILAGHVNSISGRLEFFDSDGELLAAGQHTESERGGLLFNSGQILKGITSEIDNFGGDAFDDWIERFAMSLAGILPKPETGTAAVGNNQPTISNVRIVDSRKSKQICFTGRKVRDARLVTQSGSFPMRHVASTGDQCVLIPKWLLSGTDYSQAQIEARSQFGLRAQQTIILAKKKALCSGFEVRGSARANTLSFEVVCSDMLRQCPAGGPCSSYTFRLYERQDTGAFKLTEEFGVAGLSRELSDTPAPEADSFRVFALEGRTSFQKPVSLQFNSSR